MNLLAKGVGSIFFGPSAVMAFFIISGFCIHYPYSTREGGQVPVRRFYARRYVRILIPVFAVVVLFKLLVPNTVIFGKESIFWHSTLWSLVCEEIYYFAYPAISRIRWRYGWGMILIPSFVVSALLQIHFRSQPGWNDVGFLYTTIVLLPVWLLGAYLAETTVTSKTARAKSTSEIWAWRAGVWAVSWIAGLLQFHAGIFQTTTSVFTSIFFYYWIRAEVNHSRSVQPYGPLVWAGAWSYSLYLIHPLVVMLLSPYGVFDTFGIWLVGICLILLASYLFYICVERPSHRLAQRIPLRRNLEMRTVLDAGFAKE